jgi:hypothetical protein
MWDKRMVEKIEERVGRYVVACVTENFDWAFLGVYGPNDNGEIRGHLDELVCLMNVWEMPWCIWGAGRGGF